SYSMEHFR
nr:Chain F, ACYH8 [Homo sapiens]4XPD_F Chain F, human ACTH8 [Homo sapiens]4Y49_E Chain E, Ala-ala-ala-ala-ala-ala [Homo sapiens]4Y49_K Chain K, Ala-ala-ala-ala-ala-ala [Homo sapiens]4Y49_Q Chain Q, Ala-ala-ala-ala-ala-ala [Homo sapiens]